MIGYHLERGFVWNWTSKVKGVGRFSKKMDKDEYHMCIIPEKVKKFGNALKAR